MPLTIIPNANLSLTDLLCLYQNGWFVEKSPHVGNFYPNNLAFASLGIPLLVVDQTIGEKDENFHPHRIIQNGSSEVIADATKLTSRVVVSRYPQRPIPHFEPGASLQDAHLQNLKRAIPAMRMRTTSEQARLYSDLFHASLIELTRLFPGSWSRFTESDGTVRPQSWWQCAESLAKQPIHGLSADGSGWIIPNAWNILLDCVVGALESKRDIIYLLSGPDMIVYYKKILDEIQKGYEAIRLFRSDLPATFTVHMVPVIEMRLVTTRSRAHRLDAVIDFFLALEREKFGRRTQLADPEQDPDQKRILIARCESERSSLLQNLRTALRECPEIFYEISKPTYLSQYDLLAGEELYIHPLGFERTFAQLSEMMNFFRRSGK